MNSFLLSFRIALAALVCSACGRLDFELLPIDDESPGNQRDIDSGYMPSISTRDSSRDTDRELLSIVDAGQDSDAIPDTAVDRFVSGGEPIPCSLEDETDVCKGAPCVDGFCCNSPCEGACEACNLVGFKGICTPVSNDAYDPMFGMPCDGPDRDLCEDDEYTACVDGTLVCSQGQDNVDVCDGEDNDCDGETDEDFLSTPTLCGVGACRGNTGRRLCNAGTIEDDCDPFEGASSEGMPWSTCSDSSDNDCDGDTDEEDSDCQENTPPLARFVVNPACGTIATLFEADATATTDLTDSSTDLTYLWDWNNDGEFDDNGVITTHLFEEVGSHTVVLAVEDARSVRGWARFEVNVASNADLLSVTTDQDEQDADATPASSGGTGFSLREAILYANAQSGRQTICVPAGMVIDLNDTMTVSTDSAGMILVADGSAIQDAGSDNTCLRISGENNRYLGLEIRNCGGWAVNINGGSNNQISRGYFHDNENGIRMGGSNNIFGPDNRVDCGDTGVTGIDVDGEHLVEWNTIRGCQNSGLVLSTQAAGSVVRGNAIYANGGGIELSGQANAVEIVHNTVYGNQGNGIDIANNIHDIDLRNNIISHNESWGLDASDANFSQRDYNAIYLNASGDCLGCSQLGAHSTTDNPRYIDSTTFDLRLGSGSTLIDRATDLGIDVNGAAPGNANGESPDIGAWEAP